MNGCSVSLAHDNSLQSFHLIFFTVVREGHTYDIHTPNGGRLVV